MYHNLASKFFVQKILNLRSSKCRRLLGSRILDEFLISIKLRVSLFFCISNLAKDISYLNSSLNCVNIEEISQIIHFSTFETIEIVAILFLISSFFFWSENYNSQSNSNFMAGSLSILNKISFLLTNFKMVKEIEQTKF